MKRGYHPNSRANLRSPWRTGQSGNPNGRPKQRYHPARVLLRLLQDGASDAAERLLLRAFARGEPWALDVVFGPPAPPGVIAASGEPLEPITIEVPGTRGWRVLANQLRAIARNKPVQPPVSLLRAVDAPLPELYGSTS